MSDEMPECRLAGIAPAASVAAVDLSDPAHVVWTDPTWTRWEAETDPMHHPNDYAVYAPGGEHGLEEEDYALVHVDELLDVIANGWGAFRR